MVLKNGLMHLPARVEEIPNVGAVEIPMPTQENVQIETKVHGATVARPLASAKGICEAGHAVLFDQKCSFIFHKDTANCRLDVWILLLEEASFDRRW